MDAWRVVQTRLHNLRLREPAPAAPADVVHWLGAVQSQDYGPAKWSIGERAPDATDVELDAAYAAGTILRTHVLRPTWHFVTPADIRWLLRLTGPRVHVQNAYMYRQLGLDDELRSRCAGLIVEALAARSHRTRAELKATLESAGVATEGFRLAYLLMSAELNGLICSGPLRGRQHTYALLDERVPPVDGPHGDDALSELILRYLTSHGPATVNDLRWWSSLTVADINRGIDMVSSQLTSGDVDGVRYWSVPRAPVRDAPSPTVHLLQGYDEYLVGYSQSKHLVDIARRWSSLPPGTSLPNGVAILDSQLAGHWKRTLRRQSVTFDVALYEPFDDTQMQALQDAANAQAAFLERTATVRTTML